MGRVLHEIEHGEGDRLEHALEIARASDLGLRIEERAQRDGVVGRLGAGDGAHQHLMRRVRVVDQRDGELGDLVVAAQLDHIAGLERDRFADVFERDGPTAAQHGGAVGRAEIFDDRAFEPHLHARMRAGNMCVAERDLNVGRASDHAHIAGQLESRPGGDTLDDFELEHQPPLRACSR